MAYLLALLPIMVLLVLSLTKGIRTAVLVTCIITILLFFYWGAGFSHFFAALSVSTFTTINILMIVFGATFLYNIMSHTGLIHKMSHSLDQLSPSSTIRFFLIAFGMTAFFEGVAGFGTPGAIVPLILIAMGYEALRSISTVLLFDGLFSVFGAVGTPVINGLQHPLGLTNHSVQAISLWAAVLLSLVGLLLVFIVFSHRWKGRSVHTKDEGTTIPILYLYLFFVVPYCTFAWFVPELASVMAALCMLILSVLYLKSGVIAIDLKAWIPYALLAMLLLLPKLWTGLHQWLSWGITVPNILNTGLSGTLQPLLSPLLPFLFVGFCVAYYKRVKTLQLKSSLKKVVSVSIILYPSIVIAQLMITSGVEQPSMVQYLANLMGQSGSGYPILAPFVGMIGTFITGSTTLSNIVFAPSQLETAQALMMDEQVVLSLQLAGASVGNAICLYNIIAAASIAGINNYSGILANNIWPTLWAVLALGLLGMVLVYVVN